jgi:hypothetical protein
LYAAYGSALGPLGIVIGALIGAVFIGLNWASEQAADLWNDSEFVNLLKTAGEYAEQMMFYSDCEQQALDAWCELAVFLLRKRYEDEWREHASSELLEYYDEMTKRKNQPGDDSGED